MPSPSGNLFSLGLHTLTKGIRTAWASDLDRMGIVPFPTEFHEDTNYTQIIANGSTNNTSVTLYTVPSGKSFYLTSIALAAYNNSGATGGDALLRIHNTVPAVVNLWRILMHTAMSDTLTLAFPIPIKIQADWTIRIITSAATVFIGATITGFEK